MKHNLFLLSLTILFALSAFTDVTSAAAKGFRYVVKKGDTLTSIAKTFKVKLPDLIAANKQCVPNPDVIFPKQGIAIPQYCPVCP
uniref:LysM domain-containing protein n=1 Tax=Rhizophagus clarus TaxID=94130 RepID=A0A140D097_9GLOM|nr:hypothetical protein [Rhizophagus clarus]